MAKVPTVSHPTNRPNFTLVDTGSVELAFSYSTCVGFRARGSGWVVHENVWGPTTGKHLNWLSEDKARRVPGVEFDRLVASAVA